MSRSIRILKPTDQPIVKILASAGWTINADRRPSLAGKEYKHTFELLVDCEGVSLQKCKRYVSVIETMRRGSPIRCDIVQADSIPEMIDLLRAFPALQAIPESDSEAAACLAERYADRVEIFIEKIQKER